MKPELFADAALLDRLSQLVRLRFHITGTQNISFSFPSEGKRTPVAVAHIGGGQNFVIKLHRNFSKFFRVCYNMKKLDTLGLAVPGLLFWTFRSRLGAAGHYITVEEFIPGDTIGKIPPSDRAKALTQIADSLAALHSVKRNQHGWFMTPQRYAYIQKYAQRTISRLNRLKDFMNTKTFKLLWDGTMKQAEEIGRRTNYELIHGRVNSNNLLITDSSAYIIDLLSVHFGDFTRDLIRALHRLCNDSLESKRLFFERYFLKVQGLNMNDYRKLDPFYHCDFHIGEASNSLRIWQDDKITDEQFYDEMNRNIEKAIEALFYAESSDMGN